MQVSDCPTPYPKLDQLLSLYPSNLELPTMHLGASDRPTLVNAMSHLSGILVREEQDGEGEWEDCCDA